VIVVRQDVGVRFSVLLNPSSPWADLLAVAMHCDTSGWDGVYLPDHFMPHDPAGAPQDGAFLECWGLLTAMAARTSRVRLGPLVLGNAYRHPAVVANIAATADVISGGRFVLGLGAGWQENEHTAYGIDLMAMKDRFDRFEEAVEVIRSLVRRCAV